LIINVIRLLELKKPHQDGAASNKTRLNPGQKGAVKTLY
jgi:hypothetical protein